MAATQAEEQAYLDGTHPALAGNAQGMAALRSRSNDASPASTPPSSPPRFSAVDPSPPTEPVPALRNNARGATNTGPKGVLADYASRTSSSTTQTGPKGVLADYHGHHQTLQQSPSVPQEAQFDLSTLDRELELDEDEEALRRYRLQRMREMSGSGARRQKTKSFGHLRQIGEDQFLTAVEEDENVAVVLHLYEPAISSCNILNSHLSTLARSYPHTKFLKSLATDVDFATDSEEDALPTILVYRAGRLETTLVRLDRDWGEGTKDEIEDMLRSSGAIAGSPTTSPLLSLNSSGARNRLGDLSDDDDDGEDEDE